MADSNPVCIPTLQKLESYTTELLQLSLDARGAKYKEDYDRYDLLALLLLTMKIDCPHYTKKQIEDIRQGKNIKYSGKDTDPLSLRKLLPLQRKNVDNLVKIFTKHSTALETSDPGTGKTPMGLAVGVLIKKKMIVITQSYNLSSYVALAKKFGMYDQIGVLTTYSLAIRGKEYDVNTYNPLDPDKSIINSKYIMRTKTTRPGKKRDEISWRDAKNMLFLFDEPHHSKNEFTYAHELLISAVRYINTYPGRKNKILLSGATPADKIDDLEYLTYTLGLTDEKGKEVPGFKFSDIRGSNYFLKLHNILFSKTDPRASKVSRQDLEDELGISYSVTVTIKAFKMSKHAEETIEKNNQYIADLLEGIIKKPQATKFQEIMKANQTNELEKVPTIIDLAEKGLKKRERILIFVRFYDTSNALYNTLRKYGAVLLTGETKVNKRDQIMEDFRHGNIPILITHHDAASEGVSLHSLVLNYDTLQITTPIWSGIKTKQVLDRANRICRLSKTRIIIVYVRSTDSSKISWDERIAQVMVNKLKNIRQLTTGESGDEFISDLYKEAGNITNVKTSTTLLLSGKNYE